MQQRPRVAVRPLGAFGDLTTFSFCQDKILTTGGEGGLLALDHDAWWRTAWAFKDHGKSYEAIYERDHPPGFRYVYESFGTNWRMLEIQAAIGRIQLRKPRRRPRSRRAAARRAGARRDVALLPVPPNAHGRARGADDRGRGRGDGAGGAVTPEPALSQSTMAAARCRPCFDQGASIARPKRRSSSAPMVASDTKPLPKIASVNAASSAPSRRWASRSVRMPV